MPIHADTSPENQLPIATNSVSRKSNKEQPISYTNDNQKASSITQVQAKANTSPQVALIAQLQAKADKYSSQLFYAKHQTHSLDNAPASGNNPVQLKTNVIQRQEITEAEAIKALAPVWKEKPFTIIKPWGDEGDDSNCHGYTVHGDVRHKLLPAEFLDEVRGKQNVLVFVANGRIAHSGIFENGTLKHLLKGTGILESEIGDDTMGYDARFLLPDQLQELNAARGHKETTLKQDFENLKDNLLSYKQDVLFIPENERSKEENEWAARLEQVQNMEFSEENLALVAKWYDEA